MRTIDKHLTADDASRIISGVAQGWRKEKTTGRFDGKNINDLLVKKFGYMFGGSLAPTRLARFPIIG